MRKHKVLIKIYRDDDVFIVLDGSYAQDTADIGITGLSGLDTAEIELYPEKTARGDGAFFTNDAHYRTREIVIQARCKENDDHLRRRLISFFNSKNDFRLEVTYRGETRWIRGKVYKKSLPSINTHKKPTLEVVFLCVDPFFKDIVSNVDSFARESKGFYFPYDNQVGKHFVTGIIELASERWILNQGDVATAPMIHVEFAQQVVKPKIVFGEEYIKINRTFQAGEVLKIDTSKGTVKVGDQNIIHLVAPGSTLIGLLLRPGDTLCKNSAESGAEYMNTTIYRDINYLGV